MEHGLNLLAIIAIGGALLFWSVIAPRLERWNISGPMFFVAAGLLLSNEPIAFVDFGLQSETLRSLAEVTLAIVLFGDAAAVRVRELRRDRALPGRLLGLGLPLTMAAGTVAAKLLFPGLSWWVCAVIGTAVAPTDAALGAAIIEDKRVPGRIRRVLNVESGLNDGIVTPFVNFFLIAAVSGTSLESAVARYSDRRPGTGSRLRHRPRLRRRLAARPLRRSQQRRLAEPRRSLTGSARLRRHGRTRCERLRRRLRRRPRLRHGGTTLNDRFVREDARAHAPGRRAAVADRVVLLRGRDGADRRLTRDGKTSRLRC